MNEYSGFSQKIQNKVILSAQNGDRVAMEKIYQTYAQPCFQLANRIVANQVLAQDIVHSVFVKVLKSISGFNFTGPFAGWLRQITINESISHVKKQAKHETDTEFEEESNLGADSRYDTAWWESCHDLSHLTEQLSPEARAVLFLHELEGYSHKEIATLFNKSESYSKQSLARTFRYLKKMNEVKGA
jgi:RNA polymerase sigma-70 factor (ECF subfamily)